MKAEAWEERVVHGRDEVLRDVEKRANTYSERVVQDLKDMMNDYEVDIYRLILAVGNRYGMDSAYELMSSTVTEKRLKWLNQAKDGLGLAGTDLEMALDLYIKYLKATDGELSIIDKTENRVIFKRKEYENAISHTCDVLGLDIIEVNNKIYARATNNMFETINPKLKHVVLNYHNGWYEEMIELS
jgi:hypothetical protein